MLGTAMLVVATVTILHAAFSTYEHLSYRKALGKPEGSLPQDIVIEAFISLFLAIVGAAIRTPELREVTWRSEMKHRLGHAAANVSSGDCDADVTTNGISTTPIVAKTDSDADTSITVLEIMDWEARTTNNPIYAIFVGNQTEPTAENDLLSVQTQDSHFALYPDAAG
ncbi:hypothetical protein POSPLADRAFT_1045253 [Postia placenta MAD-698-R-SB12]|uniref:Membrane magnesium transporter n=1 Tax=Postia placenta MAD-698-R-SB12 TaxID=670580 RepID=A0A1X6N6B5_9APHY|nr:hypothetical protein POSPLADRAFT_1045253 [Postia placenta MAD-698-R-SB12]OSX64134.1 hypothetical protein POSPLADRAFT_1045253 [Postia placenta MAD-698-R-SB12]